MKRVGDPVDPNTIYGPMHSQHGVDNFLQTVNEAQKLGGKVEIGGKVCQSYHDWIVCFIKEIRRNRIIWVVGDQ